MTQNSGNSPSIFVRLVVAVQDFTNQVKTAMVAGVNVVNQQGQQIQNALKKAFGGNITTNLTQAAALAVKQFDALAQKVNVAGKMVSQWGANSKVASASQQQLVDAWTKIQAVVQQTGVTVQQAAAQLIATGQISVNAAVNVVAANQQQAMSYIQVGQAVAKLQAAAQNQQTTIQQTTVATQQLAQAQQTATKSSNGLGISFQSILNGITSILSAFGILASLRGVITFFTDASKAALEFTQAQYTLAVQTGALRKVMGVGSGTLQQWQDRIKALRKELKIFSEVDVTKAVTQTIVLTRSYDLTAAQQEKLIMISAALAKTTGVDLVDASDDLVKALGGSGVVLDKYGINLRDADKAAAAFELGFTDKLMKGTDSLNAQQLALATLAAVTKKADPIIAALGDNESNLAIQIKEADSRIADSTKNIGEATVGIVLFAKGIQSDLLGALEMFVGSEVFKQFNEWLDKVNKYTKKNANIKSDIGPAPNENDYGVSINQNKIGDMLQLQKDTNLSAQELYRLGYVNEGFFEGKKEDIARFLKDMQDYYEKYHDLNEKFNKEAQYAQYNRQTKGKQTGYEYRQSQPSAGESTLDPEMVQKFGEKVLDLYHKYNDDLKKLNSDRTKDLADANKKYEQELDDLAKKNKRQLEDLATDIRQKNEDIALGYGRDVERIDRDQAQKKEDIEKQSQDKQVKLTEDFYKALKDLDNQYYFDLRDAVAENDAVAILKLQRKYNLDKQKLEDNLQDKLGEESTSVEDRLAEIEDETQRRKEELDIRHQQELEDLQIFEDRKREDIQLAQDRASVDLYNELQDHLTQIADTYKLENDLLADKYDADIVELETKFAIEENLTAAQLALLAGMYDEYYGNSGIITEILRNFALTSLQLQGINPIDVSDWRNLEESNGASTSPLTNDGNNQYSINITSDGSVDSEFLDAVVNYVADVVVDIVIQRGGIGMT